MRTEEELEYDVRRCLDQIKDQSHEDRIKTLKLLVDKYCHLTTTDIMLQKGDFNRIKDFSQKFFTDKCFPKLIGDHKYKIDGSDIRILSIVEGTIQHLNSRECLKRLPKFDYRE